MYALEYKQLYIPREALTKNRCFQGYRWKQYAVCEEREPLEQIKATKKRPEECEARLREVQPLIKNISNYQRLKPVYDAVLH